MKFHTHQKRKWKMNELLLFQILVIPIKYGGIFFLNTLTFKFVIIIEIKYICVCGSINNNNSRNEQKSIYTNYPKIIIIIPLLKSPINERELHLLLIMLCTILRFMELILHFVLHSNIICSSLWNCYFIIYRGEVRSSQLYHMIYYINFI